jgi:hypothetical protein
MPNFFQNKELLSGQKNIYNKDGLCSVQSEAKDSSMSTSES